MLRVSVVVATHERPDRLGRLLVALRGQSLPRDEYEVIVVDDGSGPETGALLEAEQAHGHLVLRSVRLARAVGPAGARNAGWALAEARLVAFTDDDCVPTPWWLEEVVRAAGENPDQILQGQTRPDPDELVAQNGKLLLTRTVTVADAGPQYQTCNIVYPRSVLAELGGFDSSYRLRDTGEDTDLALRALERAVEVVYVPEALVHHAVTRLSPLSALRDATRWESCAKLIARHPTARSVLYRRMYWNVWHFLLVRSVVALTLPLPEFPRRLLRRLVLRSHLRALRNRADALGSGPWAIPYLVLYDAVETGAILRGAIRHRTPLL